MRFAIDVFWSFRSPYSYLATGRLQEMAARYEIEVRLRPVQPLAIRKPDFFASVNPLWPGYLLRDTARVAEFLGVPFRWPRPDPVVQHMRQGRLVTAAEQPYIYRLTRLGQLASEQGRGLELASEVSRVIWGGTAGWHEGTRLREAATRAGLDLDRLDPRAVSEAARLDAAIEGNQRDLETAGHWGVPTCVFQGEPFFGQDRLDLLLWRLRQHGLQER